MLFFVYAGDPPPMVNEAHYLAKAKNYWDPAWCRNDLFVASEKAHTTFYALWGWPTLFASLETVAWVGRTAGWLMLAVGLQQLSRQLLQKPWFSVAAAVVWIAGIEYGNLAGEWVVGGIEAKVPAYGLMLLALSRLVARQWNQVWILLGAASAFHVLSGGWAVIATMFAWLCSESARSPFRASSDDVSPANGDRSHFFRPALFAGGAIALLGLIPALSLSGGATSDDSVVAARIYAYFRIRHHLLPADFSVHWYVRHGILVAMTVMLAVAFHRRAPSERWSRLYAFTAGALLVAAAGFVAGMLPAVAPDLGARLLRYYWFRLSDAAVPLLFSFLLVRCLSQSHALIRSIGGVGITIAVLLFATSVVQRAGVGVPPSVSHRLLGWDVDAPPERQREVLQDWLAVCHWARTATSEDAVFLTPRHQQTFKWYAHRAEVVNWKDVPQDVESLIAWYERFREVFPNRLGTIRVTIAHQTLRQFREKYDVDFMIVDRRVTGRQLPLVKVYPRSGEQNETYAVYELPWPE